MLSKNNCHPLLQNNNELKYNIEIDKITPSKRFIGGRDLDSRRFLWYASDVLLIAQLSSNNGSLFVPIGVDGPCNQTCWTKLNNGTVVEEIKQGAILYQDLCDKDYQMSEWFRDLMTTLVESDQDYVDPDKSYFSAIPSNETFEQYDPTNKWSTMWFTEAPLTRQSYKYPIPDHKSEQLRYESHIEK
ncbi:hypothetical protein M8J75_015181 [Diaphorina citri]|nr:hypothetical protein M8J75_015181 [Diaphorina citri]